MLSFERKDVDCTKDNKILFVPECPLKKAGKGFVCVEGNI